MPDRRSPFLISTAGHAYWIAAAVALLAYGVHAVGEEGPRAPFDGWYLGLLLLAAGAGALAGALPGERGRLERWAWGSIGAGLLAWAGGDALARQAPGLPDALLDGLHLVLYPATGAALGLLAWSRLRWVTPGLWLDAVIAALAVGAVGSTIVLPPLLEAGDAGVVPLATSLPYAFGDITLVAIAVALFAITGFQPGRAWLVLGAGLALWGAAHGAELHRVAGAGASPGGLIDLVWPAATLLLGWAAWQPPAQGVPAPLEGWAGLVVRTVFAVLALSVLAYGSVAETPLTAVALAVAALLAVTARTALTFRENIRLGDSHRQALTDDLTGLPNRRLFFDRAEQAILRARREGGKAAILLMDLDRFKEVNDTLGHHSGDVLLTAIAGRLRAALRDSDTLARLGGDEFAVILPVVQSRSSAVWVAGTLRSAVSAPVEIDQLVLDTQASVGIAMFPAHGRDVATLLRRADVAMYVAKSTQTGTEIYAPEHDENSHERLALVAELRRAMEREELVLHYQPKVDMATGGVGGVEVLTRWAHPERGLLPPADFIPLAEHSALIKPLTLYVLDHALAQCGRWAAMGLPLAVAVNVSAPHVLDLALPDEVARLLGRHGIAAEQLELELTETTLMANPARALQVLTRLSELGVSLAIDDFGVGYSSLSYLKKLPVDVLKIDRSFVASMADSPQDAMIVRSTIDLGRNLGMKVVAEGVEDQASLDELRALGCHLGQGYHLHHPVPADELTEWLTRPSAPAPGLAAARRG